MDGQVIFCRARGKRNAFSYLSRNFSVTDKLHSTYPLTSRDKPLPNRMATSLPSVTARESAQRVQRAAQLCLDMKANDVVILNLAGVTDMTDYFVIASGTSDTHVRSIGEHVIAEMKKAGLNVHHTEGLQQGRWVLLDFFDFVVHIFHPTLRSFYQIERLWSDAEAVAVEPQE
jgi:ribosome-associated protein